MTEDKSPYPFIAFVMRVGGDIDETRAFPTEAEADVFGIEESRYAELDPDDDPQHWEKYDPPVVLVFEGDNPDSFENGKYERPVAVYQRGEKYNCVKAVP